MTGLLLTFAVEQEVQGLEHGWITIAVILIENIMVGVRDELEFWRHGVIGVALTELTGSLSGYYHVSTGGQTKHREVKVAFDLVKALLSLHTALYKLVCRAGQSKLRMRYVVVMVGVIAYRAVRMDVLFKWQSYVLSAVSCV